MPLWFFRIGDPYSPEIHLLVYGVSNSPQGRLTNFLWTSTTGIQLMCQATMRSAHRNNEVRFGAYKADRFQFSRTRLAGTQGRYSLEVGCNHRRNYTVSLISPSLSKLFSFFMIFEENWQGNALDSLLPRGGFGVSSIKVLLGFSLFSLSPCSLSSPCTCLAEKQFSA